MRLWALLPALLLLAQAPADAAIQPSQFADFAFRQHPGAQLPLDSVLRDETGANVRLGDFFGSKPAIVVLEYLRCPNLCGLVLGQIVAQMKEQKLQPGRDLQFVAISIDPREKPSDGLSARADYMHRLGSTSTAGWHFLTADPAQVQRIAKVVGFPYKYDPSIDQYAHPAGYVVATADGRIAQYVLGFQTKPDLLRNAIAGAASGATRPPAYPLLCLCLGYDPQPGTVQAMVLGIVRWVSIGLAALLALFVWWIARRRRAS